MKSISKICSSLICLVILTSAYPVHLNSYAETVNSNDVPVFDKKGTYGQYLLDHETGTPSTQDILIDADNFAKASEDAKVSVLPQFNGEQNVVMWDSLSGSIEWAVSAPEDSSYCVEIKYYALKPESRNVEIGIEIDDTTLFTASSNIVLPRVFHHEGGILRDPRDNDIRPDQSPLDVWMTESLKDNEGLYNEPYRFFLSKGNHTMKLKGIRAGIAIKSIRLYNPESLPAYAEYSKNALIAPVMETVTIQGEDAAYQSDTVLYPVYDRSGPDTKPADPVKLRLNTIGQGNWNMHGQFIAWKIKAPSDGFYKIGIRFNQNLMRDLTSYRRVYINGKVPFKEADAVAFGFSDQWQAIELGDGWLFNLKKGENEIKLEVVPGPMGSIVSDLENTVFQMNFIYRKIIMITGVNADPNRDYQLDKEIPGLMETFLKIQQSCETTITQLNALSGSNTSASTSILQDIIVQMKSFIEKPDTIAIRISSLRSNISSLSALLLNMKNQSLEIDYISIGTNSGKLFYKASNAFEKISFGIQAFFGSFFEDYTSIGKVYQDQSSLNVWINLGRDQTQVIKTMSDSMFTPKTNILVNISLVQQSLVQASLSKTGPDVVIFVGQGDPVNLASRNALQDLSKFESYATVKKRFNANAFTPYMYGSGCYALPVTEDFPMMFYRTDIFSELKIEPPKTWDEFYKVISVLQRNNMTAGIPNMPPDSQMSTNNSIFAMLMKQMGQGYYNEDLSATTFDSTIGVQAFKIWTGFYSRYGLPYQFDFFNRFRTGEMPLGIDAYVLYNRIAIGAPEIKGLWKMVPIPGQKGVDGTINNQSCASSSAIIMLKGAKDKEAAWKFMDWFTSDDIQAGYGLEMESLLGASGRYNTANVNSFYKLPWSAEEQKMISEQWNNIFEIPQVPGGYFADRNLSNAFRQVVFMNKNPRETLIDYNKEINAEITKKRIEFGLQK